MKASHNSNCFICNYVLKIPKEKTPFSIGKKQPLQKYGLGKPICQRNCCGYEAANVVTVS